MAPTTSRLAELLAIVRRYRFDVEHAEALASVARPDGFRLYCHHMATLIDDTHWLLSRDGHEWATDLLGLGEEFLRERDKRPAIEAAQGSGVLYAISIGWQQGRLYPTPTGRRTRWDLDAGDYQRLATLCQKMTEHPDRMVQAYGQLFRTAIEVDRGRSAVAMRDNVAAFFRHIKPFIADPKTGVVERREAYRMMLAADALLDKTQCRGALSIDLLEFMLSQNDLMDAAAKRVLAESVFWPPVIPKSDPRWATLAARVLSVFESPRHRLVLANALEMRTLCQPNAQAASGVHSTQSASTSRPSATGGQTLLDVFDATPVQWVFAPVIHGTIIYAAGLTSLQGGGHELQLLRFTMPSGRMEKVGPVVPISGDLVRQRIEGRSGTGNMFTTGCPIITGACLDSGLYCLATAERGIRIFPIKGGNVIAMGERDGLPSTRIACIAALDGKLYAGTGRPGHEGHVVCIDPIRASCSVLASSLRKEKRSPFDNGSPFTVRSITPDPPRHRLLLTIERRGTGSEASGLWEYAPRNGQWRQLLPMEVLTILNPDGRSGTRTGIIGATPVNADHIIVASSRESVLFDLRRNQAEILLRSGNVTSATTRQVGASGWYKSESAAARHVALTWFRPLMPLALVNDWLWGTCNDGVCRVSLVSGEKQILPKPRELGRTYNPRYLLPMNDGRLLSCDYFGLFIFEPPTTPSSPPGMP